MTKDKLQVNEIAVKGIETLKSFLTGLTQAHPASLGLIVMTTCTGGILSTGDKDELGYVRIALSNLYAGAQTVAVAAAVAPVVSGGLGALGSYLAAGKTK